MTLDAILDGLLTREGPGVPPYLDPHDPGGRTAWGIAERAHPEAWQPGPPTREQARAIYTRLYVAPFDFVQAAGCDDRLRVQLIDFGVNSGVSEALTCLRRVLDLSPGFDPLPMLRTRHASRAGADRHLNNELLAERFVLEHRLTLTRQADKRFADGWDTRVASFYWAPGAPA
jgi:lysozyme family protein